MARPLANSEPLPEAAAAVQAAHDAGLHFSPWRTLLLTSLLVALLALSPEPHSVQLAPAEFAPLELSAQADS